MKLRKKIAVFLALALLCLSACGEEEVEVTVTPDEHEGMVYINIGELYDWITPAEGVELTSLGEEDFTLGDNGWPVYTGTEYTTRYGVDVSFYQGDIDWEAVAASGIEFAMIRCGYRGYGAEGNRSVDECFTANIEGAIAAGLDVGVYFFSQSLGAIEAAEEAEYVISLIEGYDITMPVAFDWEPVEQSERYTDVDAEAITSSAIVFCEIIADAGYTPCVYLYRHLAYYEYNLSRLADYMLWAGAPGDWDDFYYAHYIWQFSYTGTVDGIDAAVDLDMQYIPVESSIG